MKTFQNMFVIVCLFLLSSLCFGATPPVPLFVDLQDASDTGVYNDDDLTSNALGTIDIVAAQAGDTIRVYRSGVLLGAATFVSDTTYRYTFTAGQLTSGDNSVTARSYNGVESADSPPTIIHLDITSPTVTVINTDAPAVVSLATLHSFTVTFSEVVDTVSAGDARLTAADFTLTTPSGATVTATSMVSLGGTTYQFNIPTQAEPGVYHVNVGPLIGDLAGNLMNYDNVAPQGELEDAFVSSFHSTDGSTYFWEGFEGLTNDWSVDNGVWEIGTSTIISAHEGRAVAGTVLNDNYPHDQDSRLISPAVLLPVVSGAEQVQLRFWQWFNYGAYDSGLVQISVYDGTSKTWGNWISMAEVDNYSAVWSPVKLDMSAYAGNMVRIAFWHTAAWGNWDYEAPGWYIDEVEIWKGTPVFHNPENFENGWGDWWTDRGVWEIGTPASGPGSAHQGTGVAGTILNGDYPHDQDSRLISPAVLLPVVSGAEQVQLRFWQWFNYGAYDSGLVQISVYDGTSKTWGNWISMAEVDNYSAVWSPVKLDMSAYAGNMVRIAFWHTAAWGNWDYEAPGWYIDEVEIWKGTPVFHNPENFENGWGDWWTDRGVWEIGTPASGPGSAHQGTGVAGTILNGDYPHDQDSRLISPAVLLPVVSGGEQVQLQYWQWFSYGAYDSGAVQISVYNDTAKTWGDWATIGNVGGNAAVWTQVLWDISTYAGKTVRFAFLHSAAWGNWDYEAPGWYIDEVRIVAPSVLHMVINIGQTQRSQLSGISLTFTHDMNLAALIAAGTIDDYVKIYNKSTGAAVSWLDQSRFEYMPAGRTLNIDLSKDGLGGSSYSKMDDGRYEVKLDLAAIKTMIGSNLLDDDGKVDGFLTLDRTISSGINAATQDCFQFCGDADGDGDVDFADLFNFRKTYQKSCLDSNYKWIFDFDGDCDVDFADLFKFRNNYQKTLP